MLIVVFRGLLRVRSFSLAGWLGTEDIDSGCIKRVFDMSATALPTSKFPLFSKICREFCELMVWGAAENKYGAYPYRW